MPQFPFLLHYHIRSVIRRNRYVFSLVSYTQICLHIAMDAERAIERITTEALAWLETGVWANYLSRLRQQRYCVTLRATMTESGINALPIDLCSIAVTDKLLRQFDEDEQEWVLIHELSHLMIPKDYACHQWTHEILFDLMGWAWFRMYSIDTGKIVSGIRSLPNRSDLWHCPSGMRARLVIAIAETYWKD